MRQFKIVSLISAVTLSIVASGYASAETANRGGARDGRGQDLVSAALIEATDGDVHGLSNLYRIRSGIGMTAHVWGLTAGHPYTVWAVVFNNPRHCGAYPEPCGPDDFAIKRVQARVTQASHNFPMQRDMRCFRDLLSEEPSSGGLPVPRSTSFTGGIRTLTARNPTR